MWDGKDPIAMTVETPAVPLETILEMPERYSMENFFEAIFRSTLFLPFGVDNNLVLAGPEHLAALFAYTRVEKKSEGLFNDPVALLLSLSKPPVEWRPVSFGPLIPSLAGHFVPVNVMINAGTKPNIVLNTEVLQHMAKAIAEAGR